jgi:hypothetical protein
MGHHPTPLIFGFDTPQEHGATQPPTSATTKPMELDCTTENF